MGNSGEGPISENESKALVDLKKRRGQVVLEQIKTVGDFLERAADICADETEFPGLNAYVEQPILNALTDAARDKGEHIRYSDEYRKEHVRVLAMTMDAQDYIRRVTGWVNIPESGRHMKRDKAASILREASDLARAEQPIAKQGRALSLVG